ncbi:putative NAD dependent epimerase/dehydratase [Xylaria intraflava]|nr:putative NAD dependent epimerase/dehydratase [Xylaria intraflava]
MAVQKQRIFMTGGSGYIGSRIVELALREGHTIRALSRSAAGTAKLQALGAEPVPGDVSSLDILRAEAAQADVVIHLADPWIDNFSAPYEKVIGIDGAAVDAMVQGLAKSTGRKLLIDTSGVGVVKPDDHDGETDEDAAPNPNPLNGRIHRETHSLSKAGHGGVRVCMMRLPPFVYGRGASGVKLFMEIFAKLGFVPCVGGGTTRTSVVHVDDAARAYVLAITRACVGDGNVRAIYNLTSSTETTFRELGAAMADALALPLREMSVSETTAAAGGLVAGFFSDRIRGRSDKARRELGWVLEGMVGVIEDIRSGSYVELAEKLRAGAQASAA